MALSLLILSLIQMSTLSPIIENFLKKSPPIPCFEGVPLPELRNRFDERQKKINENLPTHNLTIQDQQVQTSRRLIPIRIYQSQAEGLSPVLIFFHGGGFVFGNLDTLEGFCREIAYFTKCTVISADYPLAPENPFPEAPESAYEVTNWIYNHLSIWKGDRNRVYIGGSSSGATLAAVVCMMLRDRGGPKLNGQILLCPLTDMNFDTPSYHENASGYNLTREHCLWFVSKYLTNDSQRKDPRAALLQATNFKDLPSALVITAEFDPLRDEGREYAKKLQESGVKCEDLYYKGMVHGFPTLPLQMPEKVDVLEKIKEFLNSR